MSGIAKSIWYIESRFRQDVSLDDLADMAGMSKFHLSRAFSLTTGYTVSGYLRGRRLTEAARTLAAGAPDILAVALDFGYGSHEAFTRAFRDQFGRTPEEVRRQGNLDGLRLVQPMSMHPATPSTLIEPSIETIGPLRLAGLISRHPVQTGASIPEQWQRFQPFLGNIDGQAGGGSYGVIGEVFDDGTFDYFCGVAVTDPADLPPELTGIEISRRQYARFTHPGHVTTIRATVHHVYANWLPTAGRVPDPGCAMIEHYGQDFDGRTGFGTIEIWLGLKG
ncbi:AraC family transcriptional regulator [Devosia sp.]|uniref:AraC family transcriptional regulator n=1 Tax=Devosia sp. TaxID=1871048 RepID=UPI003265ED64